MNVKLTKFAKYLLHKKFYPRQAEVVAGRSTNSNKACYNMLAEAGVRSRNKR